MKIFLLGFFDCMHVGHRYLLENARKISKSDSDIYITTFDDGFLSAVGRREDEIYSLTERKEIIAEIGDLNLIVFPTESSFVNMDKNSFLSYIVSLRPSIIVVGKDYRFGQKAEGDVSFLQSFLQEKRIQVNVCDFYRIDGKKVSTSFIKELLYQGKIQEANYQLGAPFFYSGIVAKGRQDGGKIGIPTMNICIPDGKIKIKSGVYVTETIIENKSYLSVTNVGTHPTFSDDNFNIETHVIGETINSYGKKIKIIFYQFIRNIMCFNTKDNLIKQIDKDIKFAKEVLKNGKIRRSGE